MSSDEQTKRQAAEFIRKNLPGVRPGFPAGHYASPVVNPAELVGARAPDRSIAPEDMPGITIDLGAMRRWWEANAAIIRTTPFTAAADPRWRYYFENRMFSRSDAAVLRAMIAGQRPTRVIEVGSGFSTACILDAIDEFGLATTVTCIEPGARRLHSLLKPGDDARVQVIERPVQEIPVSLFGSLAAGDILFIDSSHVLKTGSDVHYELFSILPALARGVLIHFHDIFFPFEYPNSWIYERQYSWNEAYALRAFLMYNDRFGIMFMNHLFLERAADLIVRDLPQMTERNGGSIWIEKVA